MIYQLMFYIMVAANIYHSISDNTDMVNKTFQGTVILGLFAVMNSLSQILNILSRR